MVAATLRRPGRALARVSLRIYPFFRRLTKVQAAILLALLLGEGVVFGALVSVSAGPAPGVVLFTPSYALGQAGQPAAADQIVLAEETVATGEAAR